MVGNERVYWSLNRFFFCGIFVIGFEFVIVVLMVFIYSLNIKWRKEKYFKNYCVVLDVLLNKDWLFYERKVNKNEENFFNDVMNSDVIGDGIDEWFMLLEEYNDEMIFMVDDIKYFFFNVIVKRIVYISN